MAYVPIQVVHWTEICISYSSDFSQKSSSFDLTTKSVDIGRELGLECADPLGGSSETCFVA